MTPSGILDFTAWARLTWVDDRLEWDKKEYHGVYNIRVPGHELWSPDIEIYNSLKYGPGFFSAHMKERPLHAVISSDGSVLYIPQVHGKVQCSDKSFSDWPYGEYECEIKMGSWTFHGNQ